ncbi:MAG: DegT/DnrJ/EryC1/StrS family aminotransferase [Anaerolineales bacterium]|nr:DegT/DnrJ/EryC1/StrS family aminotransferase [Anaerolineales bacterium]
MSEDSVRAIPMSSPDLTDLERDAVASVMETSWLAMGPQIQGFEDEFAAYAGMKHAIAVSSGTTGLHLCVRAAGIERGDWVLTTPFSFISSSNIILYEQAVPVFVDVDPMTGNMDMVQAAEATSDLMAGGRRAERWLPRKSASQASALRALLPIDVFGQPADYDALDRIAQEHQLTIIEDSCEALGSEYRGKKAGSFGDAGVFAFYPNKQMTTGEGGIVVTDRDDWAQSIKSLSNQGRAPGDTWLQHTFLGYNYRMTEMSAALGRAQLSRLDELISKRTQVAAWYEERLKNLDGVQTLPMASTTSRMSWFVYVIRFDARVDRSMVMRELERRGIPSRPYFSPIHLQPYFMGAFGYQPGDYPVTETLGAQNLALPFSSVMREDEVAYVCDALATLIA